MTGAPIRSVAVVGGGVAGWSAAAAFARRLRGVVVTVVQTPPLRPRLNDLYGGTTPSAALFHAELGLDEATLVARAGASFRLGGAFEGWVEGRADYVHGYGDHGAAMPSAAFHQYWLRLGSEAGGFGLYSTAEALARAGRFAAPSDDPRSPLSRFEYGMQLDPAPYAALLRAHALRLGALVRETEGFAPEIDGESGRRRALLTTGGGRVEADLFVDCGGALADALDDRRESWASWLPCDAILFAEGPPPRVLPPIDRAVATLIGWRLEAPLLRRTVHAMTFATAHTTNEEALRRLRTAVGSVKPGATLTLAQGRRARAWIGNVVAIGEACVTVEPLEAAPLHLLHAHIERIIASLPGRDFAQVELDDYNRRTAAEADRVRDLAVLHYATARRRGEVWRAAAEAPPPESLARDLALFAERGRLPVHDGETFSRDSRLSVLFGQGVIPRRHDPLADALPREQVAAALTAMRASVAAAVSAAPTHQAYLQRFMEPAQ